ncbi:MAG: ferredoxin--NADP reductase [Patescibacteria group bacterium]
MIHPPQQFIARFEDKQQLNDKFWLYSFELENPFRMEFEAGQYVSIKINAQGERRAYSIASSPEVNHGFELLLDVEPNGLGVHYLQNLQFGDKVSMMSPMGRFVLQQEPREAALTLVATGSGIAPLRGMVLWLLQAQHDTRPIVLHWGLRSTDHLAWEEDFTDLMQAFPNFKFHPVISQAPQAWPLCKGHVTDCLNYHQHLPESGYYLCGSREMVEDTKALLLAKGISPMAIHHEMFS